MRVLLIDADNFSAPGWIDEACAKLEADEGSFAVRRAYGSGDNLRGIADCARKWSIRPFLNLALSKNTTDVALAVDAMELACSSPRPNLIALASGDADFLPLVVRLRERGIRVICVSEISKMSAEAQACYDQVLLVGSGVAPVANVAAKPKKKSIAKASVKAAAKAPAKAAAKTEGKTAAKTSIKKAARKSNAQPANNDEATVSTGDVQPVRDSTYERILHLIPSLQSGEWHPLGEVAKKLHDDKLLGKNATTTKLFKKYPKFELDPADKPNRVRLTSTS